METNRFFLLAIALFTANISTGVFAQDNTLGYGEPLSPELPYYYSFSRATPQGMKEPFSALIPKKISKFSSNLKKIGSLSEGDEEKEKLVTVLETSREYGLDSHAQRPEALMDLHPAISPRNPGEPEQGLLDKLVNLMKACTTCLQVADEVIHEASKAQAPTLDLETPQTPALEKTPLCLDAFEEPKLIRR